MSKRIIPVAALCLLAATAAHAQYGGGGMGGGGMGGGGMGGGMGDGGGRHGGHGGHHAPSSDTTSTPAPPKPPDKSVSDVEIIGVIKGIDPNTNRITIAYEPVEALRWPAGTMPFVVSKSALMKGASVGEKVRFKLDSQQISSLTPF